MKTLYKVKKYYNKIEKNYELTKCDFIHKCNPCIAGINKIMIRKTRSDIAFSEIPKMPTPKISTILTILNIKSCRLLLL